MLIEFQAIFPLLVIICLWACCGRMPKQLRSHVMINEALNFIGHSQVVITNLKSLGINVKNNFSETKLINGSINISVGCNNIELCAFVYSA